MKGSRVYCNGTSDTPASATEEAVHSALDFGWFPRVEGMVYVPNSGYPYRVCASAVKWTVILGRFFWFVLVPTAIGLLAYLKWGM